MGHLAQLTAQTLPVPTAVFNNRRLDLLFVEVDPGEPDWLSQITYQT